MRRKGIVLAADIPEKRELLDLVSAVGPYVAGVKISNLVFYENGWSVVTDLKRICQVPIIADLKLMEIPFMAQRLVAAAYRAGVDGVMICGAAGEETVRRCTKHFPGMVFVVTQFTHCRDVIPDEAANSIIDVCLRHGCYGVQVPGTFPDRVVEVREKVGGNLKIICCGIGRQGPRIGSAISAGADYEIVGREIYDASDGRSYAERARTASDTVNQLT